MFILHSVETVSDAHRGAYMLLRELASLLYQRRAVAHICKCSTNILTLDMMPQKKFAFHFTTSKRQNVRAVFFEIFHIRPYSVDVANRNAKRRKVTPAAFNASCRMAMPPSSNGSGISCTPVGGPRSWRSVQRRTLCSPTCSRPLPWLACSGCSQGSRT